MRGGGTRSGVGGPPRLPCRLGKRGARRYPQALTLPACRWSRGGPNYAKLGRGVPRGTYRGGRPGSPRPSCSSSRSAVAEEAISRLSLLRSCHPPPRVRPLCEPAALWLSSLSGLLGRGDRGRRIPSARAEASGDPWRPRAAVPPARQPRRPWARGLGSGYPQLNAGLK